MSAALQGLWAVLCREIAERRLLLLAAALVGLVPLAVPFLPGVAAPDPGEIRTGTALALCLVVTAVLALTLGATVIAGDLSERRLGFYFSRPLAGWAIWALFLSDHSAVRLMGLGQKKHTLEQQLASTSQDVTRRARALRVADDPDEAARVLRERHNFAAPGERLYRIEKDGSIRTEAPLDSSR